MSDYYRRTNSEDEEYTRHRVSSRADAGKGGLSRSQNGYRKNSNYARYADYEARVRKSEGYGRYDDPDEKKKHTLLWLIPIIVVLVLAAAATTIFFLKPAWAKNLINKGKDLLGLETEAESETETEEPPEIIAYLASDGEAIGLYRFVAREFGTVAEGSEGESYEEPEKEMILTDTSLPRGTEVIFMNETILIGYDGKEAGTGSFDESESGDDGQALGSSEAVEYSCITYNEKEYYVLSEHLTTDYDLVVTETVKFVRTSVTVYENNETPEIASFIKKGAKLNITGFSGLNSDGSVEMYEVTGMGADGSEASGWVYSKYLVDSEEEAEAVYNEDGIYDIHKDRTYSYELYGGSPQTLDYYPCEKPVFEDNPIMEEAMSMYITAGNVLQIDDYIALALDSGVNTMVVDIKDGYVCVELETTKEQCPSAYEAASFTAEQYKECIDKIKDAGIYVIGRIVAFNDSQYGAEHPETSIISSYLSSYWPSAFSRQAWYYNVCLAIECVETFGFNEIQFDYVRFPEASYRMSQEEGCDFKNAYYEEKAEAIQNFLYYACDQVHKTGAYVSVDVFGECSDAYVTAYGQYWPAISNVVDATSGMPYVDHFGQSVDTWSDPYQTVYNWAVKTVERQNEIPTPSIARTWLTCYDVPNWDPVITCDANMMISQIQALYDAGLNGGFMPWNGKGSLTKYYLIAECWSRNYGR